MYDDFPPLYNTLVRGYLVSLLLYLTLGLFRQVCQRRLEYRSEECASYIRIDWIVRVQILEGLISHCICFVETKDLRLLPLHLKVVDLGANHDMVGVDTVQGQVDGAKVSDDQCLIVNILEDQIIKCGTTKIGPRCRGQAGILGRIVINNYVPLRRRQFDASNVF